VFEPVERALPGRSHARGQARPALACEHGGADVLLLGVPTVELAVLYLAVADMKRPLVERRTT
jgi:hypothetical protein